MADTFWENTTAAQGTKEYRCPFCGKEIATNLHFNQKDNLGRFVGRISICHSCLNPTYFAADKKQYPGNRVGREVEGIDSANVAALYNEARNCLAVSATTASILCSRKLLMNISVSKGAKPGQSFTYYVDYLCDNNFVPPDSKDWVDHIRTKGNEATHEISIASSEEAEELVLFIEMILIFIYEFPFKVRQRKAQA